MRSNKATLRDLGRTALSTFREASLLLDLSHADTSRLDGVRYMNAGWTKVYALMLDGFPIYDGRVGAAMGYLVQRYCVSACFCQVPTRLRFRWGAARGRHNRNPSTRSLWFPRLTATNPRTWAGDRSVTFGRRGSLAKCAAKVDSATWTRTANCGLSKRPCS